MIDRTLAPGLHQPLGGWLGVAAAFAIGFLVLPLLRPIMFGPHGTFGVIAVAGCAAVVVQPGWGGFVASAAGLTAFTTLTAVLAGFSDLHFLALAFVLVALAAGACGGSIVNTLRERGSTQRSATAGCGSRQRPPPCSRSACSSPTPC